MSARLVRRLLTRKVDFTTYVFNTGWTDRGSLSQFNFWIWIFAALALIANNITFCYPFQFAGQSGRGAPLVESVPATGCSQEYM
jgi:hypothetical protein